MAEQSRVDRGFPDPRAVRDDVVERRPRANRPHRDQVAVEEPLEIRLDGDPIVVTMRSPGDDRELALGYLYAEGFIEDATDIKEVTLRTGPPERANLPAPPTRTTPTVHGAVIDVELSTHGRRRASQAERRRERERAFRMTSACGVCGKPSLEDLWVRLPPIEPLPLDAASERRLVESLPAAMTERQHLFDATGGAHAAAVFEIDHNATAGAKVDAARPRLRWLGEDIGRHNAVDKVLGSALLAGRLPLSTAVLAVSGRLGFEILQKAAIGGIPVVASVGAPSSLALDIAHLAGIHVYAFVARDRSNYYPKAGVEIRAEHSTD